MSFLLDTSVVIALRDDDALVAARMDKLGHVVLSAISRAELESGVYAKPAEAANRRRRLDLIIDQFPTLVFGPEDAMAYGAIVEAAGYSRRKLIDRLIAAQALVHRATLVTLNPDDFRDVPGLQLLDWS